MSKQRVTVGVSRGYASAFIDGNLRSQLLNALSVAAERYDENAKEFRTLKPQLLEAETKASAEVRLIHSSACDPLAEQFERQAADTRKLIGLFNGEDENGVETEDDEPRIVLYVEEG
jgi:hypothetical protein